MTDMPWNWNKAPTVEELAGPLGTPKEAKQAGAWPDYEAAYLKSRLTKKKGRYDPGTLADDPIEKLVYLNKVSKDYEKDADQMLRIEFESWLQGTHEDNLNPRVYKNAPDKPRRLDSHGRRVDNWIPTHWGRDQLCHLDGVRDFLRAGEQKRQDANFEMNLLAEFGPQNLEEAWMYFKHWVKGRPINLDDGIDEGVYTGRDYSGVGTGPVGRNREMGNRSKGWHLPPENQGQEPYGPISAPWVQWGSNVGHGLVPPIASAATTGVGAAAMGAGPVASAAVGAAAAAAAARQPSPGTPDTAPIGQTTYNDAYAAQMATLNLPPGLTPDGGYFTAEIARDVDMQNRVPKRNNTGDTSENDAKKAISDTPEINAEVSEAGSHRKSLIQKLEESRKKDTAPTVEPRVYWGEFPPPSADAWPDYLPPKGSINEGKFPAVYDAWPAYRRSQVATDNPPPRPMPDYPPTGDNWVPATTPSSRSHRKNNQKSQIEHSYDVGRPYNVENS